MKQKWKEQRRVIISPSSLSACRLSRANAVDRLLIFCGRQLVLTPSKWLKVIVDETPFEKVFCIGLTTSLLTGTTRNVNFPTEENPRKYYWKLQLVSIKDIWLWYFLWHFCSGPEFKPKKFLIGTVVCHFPGKEIQHFWWCGIRISEQDLQVKAMDDIGVVMTPFGYVVTVILVVNSYVLRSPTQGVGHVDWFYKVARGNDKNYFSGARHPWP